jgi:hypothetical protein
MLWRRSIVRSVHAPSSTAKTHGARPVLGTIFDICKLFAKLFDKYYLMVFANKTNK